MRVYALEVQDASIQGARGNATYTRRPTTDQLAYNAADLAPRAASTVPMSHRVANGENLTRIVQEHLSATGNRPTNTTVYEAVGIVARTNGLSNPDLIHPGQVIDLSALHRGDPGVETTPSGALPALTLPTPGPVSGLPAPRRILQGIRALEAPSVAEAPAADKRALADTMLNPTPASPVGEPIRISRSAVAALVAPPATSLKLARAPKIHGGPTGGPGPVPSDAVVALQRVLNGTSTALHALRDLMDGEPALEADTEENGPWASLVNGKARLSSEFGTRKDPFTGRMEFHEGVDLAVKRGTDITAVRDGVVVHSGWKGGYGNTVILSHEDGVETLYAHAARTRVVPGQKVKAGSPIADAGSSGRSTGPHVHFEVREHGRAVNPMPYLADAGGGAKP